MRADAWAGPTPPSRVIVGLPACIVQFFGDSLSLLMVSLAYLPRVYVPVIWPNLRLLNAS